MCSSTGTGFSWGVLGGDVEGFNDYSSLPKLLSLIAFCMFSLGETWPFPSRLFRTLQNVLDACSL